MMISFFILTGFTNSQEVPTKDTTPYTCDYQDVKYHLDRTKALWKRGYDNKRWQDKTPVTKTELKAIRDHKFCLNRKSDRARVADQRDKFKKKFGKYRDMQLFVQNVTPYPGPNGTYWAIPYYIVDCESGGNFQAYSTDFKGGGAYGILDSTWPLYGGPELSGVSRADLAKPIYQHIIAARIRDDVGINSSSWECS